MILAGGFFNAGKHCHTWNWFYSRLFKQGSSLSFSELRQPMVGNVCAIGKHPEKLASRTNILKDCVLCTDPIDSVLFKFHPTILIVAVPPTVSVDIAKTILLPYYNTLRAASQPLPDLYSFTPTPDENWYANLLGNDVSIVKILPNIFTDVHGIDITSVGINTISTTSAFKHSSRRALLDLLLTPYGKTVSLSASQALIFLAGKITSHVCCEACFCIHEAAQKAGLSVTLNDIGKAFQYAQRSFTKFFDDPVPSLRRNDLLPSALLEFMQHFSDTWFSGLHDFTTSMPVCVSDEEALSLDVYSYALNTIAIAVKTKRSWSRIQKMPPQRAAYSNEELNTFMKLSKVSLAIRHFLPLVIIRFLLATGKHFAVRYTA